MTESRDDMKVLAVVNMLPQQASPRAGTFVARQIEGLRRIGLHVDVLLIDRPNRGALTYGRTGGEVRRALQATRYDVVHVTYGGVMAFLATRAVGPVPVVVSFCGVDLLGADYGSLRYRLRTAVGVRASFGAARRADQIIVKSRNLEQGLPADVIRSRVTIIPNGVDLDVFRPLDRRRCREQVGWPEGRFCVLFSTADRRNQKKRLHLAEDALEVLREKGVDAEIHGLTGIPHDEVPVWLNAADVLLFTSRADEGSPNIVKEALACNRPVVSVDVGDVAERIGNVPGCHLAEPIAKDLADKLYRVVVGPRSCEGRRHMRELTIERIGERVVEVYRRAVGSRRPGRRR